MSPDLPDLPAECSELTATTPPNSDAALTNHLKDLPGLNPERFERLREIALPTRPQEPGDPILGLGDLLRQQANGQLAIHPRVAHVVPVNKLDPLVIAIAPSGDNVAYWKWCQYVNALLECRNGEPCVEAIYPPEYNIRVADAVRALRGHGVLTSVKRPGQRLTRRDELEAAAREMQKEDEGKLLLHMAVIHQPDDEPEPTLYLAEPPFSPSGSAEDYLHILCSGIFNQHGLSLDVEPLP